MATIPTVDPAAAAAAPASSSSNFWLADLDPKLLLKIFRNVPLEDKLRRLWDMPEFRRPIRSRASYFPDSSSSSSSLPFSVEYVRDLLRPLRFGWYAARGDWAHRLRVYADERTLDVRVDHYYLLAEENEGRRGEEKNVRTVSRFFGGSVENARTRLENYLNRGCLYLEEEEEDSRPSVYYYYLKRYGFVAVGPSPLGGNPWRRILFPDRTACDVRADRWQRLYEPGRPFCHFNVMPTTTREGKLFVECTFREKGWLCLCETGTVVELSPIVFRVSPSPSRTLTCEGAGGKDLGGVVVPPIGYQEFSLTASGRHVEVFACYREDVMTTDQSLEMVKAWTHDGGPGFGKIQEEAVEVFAEEEEEEKK